MRLALVISAALLVAACGSSDGGEAPEAAASTPAPSISSPTPASDAPSPEAPASDASASPSECPADVRSGIEATIGSQLEALAQADFASAREFASESFQATVNERQFRAIIEGEFAVLLTDPEVGFDVCVSLGEVAEILVRVDSDPPAGLRYRLVREPDGWRVDGASIISAQDDATTKNDIAA